MFTYVAKRSTQSIMGKRGVSTLSTGVSSFKGVLFGFFAGVSLTGFGTYYYLLDQYKITSNAVVSDVLLLQKSVKELESYVKSLESQIPVKK